MARLEAKTGYLALSEAIADGKEEVKPYHFSNEANLLNRIVLGKSAKQFKKECGMTGTIREYVTFEQLSKLSELQQIDTSLLKMGLDYQLRKELLQAHHEGRNVTNLLQANG